MERTKRFTVGQQLTYKSKKDCPGGCYMFGGDDQGGFVGILTAYREWDDKHKCYVIHVTTKSSDYTMLENEFIEYQQPDLFVLSQTPTPITFNF